MQIRAYLRLAMVCGLTGCASPRPPVRTAPPPSPAVPEPISTAPGSWSFSLAPGTVAYRVERTAVIEQSDSGATREISSNSTYESIAVEFGGDTIHFTATVDTFSTTTQGVIGAVPSTSLPLQVSGSLVANNLTISSVDSIAGKCNPVETAVITDLRNLLPRFPSPISTGSSWNDSTSSLGCQGSISTMTHITRSYQVVGESTYEGTRILVVQRADSIQAAGEGAQQQHRLLLDARGTGTATYYLDISSGRLLHLSISQDSNLTVTASGRTSHFRQNAKQEFALVH
jgi:hypothetical protein